MATAALFSGPTYAALVPICSSVSGGATDQAVREFRRPPPYRHRGRDVGAVGTAGESVAGAASALATLRRHGLGDERRPEWHDEPAGPTQHLEVHADPSR
jgi:hypothetical protein